MIPAENTLVMNNDGVYVVDQTENELKELLATCELPILDRKTMGMQVQVSHHEETNKFLLECETNAAHKIVEIEPDKLLHAFYHPCLYVANPSELFPKSKSL